MVYTPLFGKCDMYGRHIYQKPNPISLRLFDKCEDHIIRVLGILDLILYTTLSGEVDRSGRTMHSLAVSTGSTIRGLPQIPLLRYGQTGERLCLSQNWSFFSEQTKNARAVNISESRV